MLRWWVLGLALQGCAGSGGVIEGGGDLGGPGCSSQDDCADGSVCEPNTVGANHGNCAAPSTKHCASCASDSDCGSPTARCLQAPGDDETACHIDCSLSFIACPAGYNCSLVADGMTSRQLCLPMNDHCNTTQGGSCTSGMTQPCSVSAPAGTCTGQRTCAGGVLSDCDAPTPMFLDDCAASPPPGCTVQHSTAAISTGANCGSCGNACPGASSTTADTACVDPTTSQCGISCRGDNYDLDGNAANGCEVADGDSGDHDASTPTKQADTDCSDGDSQNTISGQLLSDARMHLNPNVVDFSATVGAAPHWYSVYSSGGLCDNDYSLTLTTTGGPAVPCYQATITTDKIVNSVVVSGAGSGTIAGGAGSYSSDTTILIEVQKTCSVTSVGDAQVAFTVSYHL